MPKSNQTNNQPAHLATVELTDVISMADNVLSSHVCVFVLCDCCLSLYAALQ